jgi:hypothetical protein
MNFKELINLPPLTDLQRLRYKAGFIKREIDRYSKYKPSYVQGVYGTSAACASEARFAISVLKEQLAELEVEIARLQSQEN